MKHFSFYIMAFAIASLAMSPVSGADKKAKAKGEEPKEYPLGYTDTPMLPGQQWRVHDLNRPQPRIVTPGAKFSDMAPPPSDAVVLFDGKDFSKWTQDGTNVITWKCENGYMEVAGKGGLRSKDEFGDFQLHLEFATPAEVVAKSQGRGNSGVLIYGSYEIQILDCYNNPTYADGTVGAVYGQTPPLANASRKPGEWQTYEIIFETARWDESGKLVKPANVTVILNGVLVQHKTEFIGFVRHKEVAKYTKPHPPKGPIVLQDHRNPMRFRNIWIRPLGERDQALAK